VLGKDIPLNLVRRVTPVPEGELSRIFSDLEAGEFIYERPSSEEAASYTFKHALTQEVAYNSMLMERRRLLHERTGEATEALFKDRIHDHLAELAHYYSRSANVGKAVNMTPVPPRGSAVGLNSRVGPCSDPYQGMAIPCFRIWIPRSDL